MTKDYHYFAQRLEAMFPEKQGSLAVHMEMYGEFLHHVYFAEEINYLLVDLLAEHSEKDAIRRYVSVIEEMLLEGDGLCQNVVNVTILERLGDDDAVWHNFSRYVTKQFRWKVNGELAPANSYVRKIPLTKENSR